MFVFYNPILLGCFDIASLVNDSLGMKEIFHVEFPHEIKLAKDFILRFVSAVVGRR